MVVANKLPCSQHLHSTSTCCIKQKQNTQKKQNTQAHKNTQETCTYLGTMKLRMRMQVQPTGAKHDVAACLPGCTPHHNGLAVVHLELTHRHQASLQSLTATATHQHSNKKEE